MHNQSTTPTISVIVPVYNAEKYLRCCIDSVLAQTFTDFELLLIDDGSKDKSGEICDEYSAHNDRIISFHGENKGCSAARNTGFMKSKGTYVCFVDADDMLFPDYLQKLYDASNGVDVVCTGVRNEDISGEQFAKRLLCNTMKWFLHGKMYHRNVFRDGVLCVPAKFYIGEDLIINIRLSNNVNRARLISYQGYYYREHEESTTHTCRVSLEYEETFIEMVIRSLGGLRDACHCEIWYFKLRYIRQMIRTRKQIERDKLWVRETLNNKEDMPIGIGEKLILYIPNFKLCYLLLVFGEYLSKFRFVCR